ncbi:hypothetical protein NC652_001818 [Populus alba x Populus x berolinensis]|nr:hypothetical protein NC652_001818 [Populus alba x Populus x berolinensis]
MKPISLTCQILSVKNAANSYIQIHVQIQNNSGGGSGEEISILFKTNMILGILLNQKNHSNTDEKKAHTSMHYITNSIMIFCTDFLSRPLSGSCH